MKGQQLFLKPEEGKFLSMAVVRAIEELSNSAKNPTINWNPQSRKTLNDMIAAGNALKIKLERLGIDMRPLPDADDDEMQDYMTKQS